MDQPLPPWPTGLTMSRSGRTIKTPKKYLHDPNEVINPSVKQAAAAVKAAVPVVLKPSIRAVAATRSRASSRREAGAAVPGSSKASSVRPASAPLLGQPRAQLAAQPAEPSQAQSAHAIAEHKDAPQAEPRKCNIRNCPSTRLAERIPTYISLFEEAVACTFRKGFDNKACGYTTHCKYHLVEHVFKTHVEGHHFITDEVSEQFDSEYYTLCHDCGIYDDKLEDHLKEECATRQHTVMIAKRYQPRITSSDREKWKYKTTRQDIEDQIEACDHGSSDDDDDDDDKDESHIIKPNDLIGNKNQYLVERFTSCSHYKWQGVIFMVKFLEYEDAPSKELLKDLHCYRIIQKFCAEKQAEKGRILTRKAKPVSSDVLEARKNSMVFSKEDYFDAIHDWNFKSGELLVFFKFMTDDSKKGDQDEAYYYQRVAFWIKLDRLMDLDDESCVQGVANFIDEQVPILRYKMQASKSVNASAAAVASTSTASINPESPLSQDHGYLSMPGGTAPSSNQISREHHKKIDEDDTDSSNKDGEEPMNTEEQSNRSNQIKYRVGLNCPSISRLLSTGISGEKPVVLQPQDNMLDTINRQLESERKLHKSTSINKDVSEEGTGLSEQMASDIINDNSGSFKRCAGDSNDGAVKSKKVKTCKSTPASSSSFASIKPVKAITEQATPDNEDHFKDSQANEAPKNDPGPNVILENELKNVNNKANSPNVKASAATDDAESCLGNLVIDEDDACGGDRVDLIGQNIKNSEEANMPPTNDAVNINNESSKAEEQAPTSCGTEERNKDKEESNMEAESKPQNPPKMTSLINECNEDSSDGILNKVKKRSDETSLSLMAITLKNSESSAQPHELPSGGTEKQNEKNKISANLTGLSKRSADDSNYGALKTKKQKTCASSSTTGSSSSASIEPIVVNKKADGENENQDNQADEDIEAPENYSAPNVVLPNIGYNQMNLHIGMTNVPSVIDYDDNSIPALIIDEDEETNQEIDKVMHNEQSEPSEELASTSIDSQEKSDEKDGSKVKQPEMSPKEFLDGKFNEGKKHETVGNLPRDEEKTIEQASNVSLTDRTSNNNESSEHLDVLYSTSAATDKENNEEIESTIDKVLKKGQSEQYDILASTPVGSQEQADEKDESKKEMNQPEEPTKESSTIIEDEGKEDDEDGILQSDLKIFDELVPENSEIDDFHSNRESKLSISFVPLGPVTQNIHSHEHIEKATSSSEVKMQSLNDDEMFKGEMKEITDEIIEKVSKESVEFADMLTLDEQPSSSSSSSLSSSESQSLKTDPSNDSSAEINISFNEQNVFAANQINEQANYETNNVANINIFELIPVSDFEENFPPQYNEHINMANNFDFNNNNNNNFQYFGNVLLPLQDNIHENNEINDLNEELQLPPSHGINLGAEMLFEFDEYSFN